MAVEASQPEGPGKVLLVDDHPAMREVLRSLLEEVGGWVVVGEASSGEEAIPLVDRLQPDVVLMDCKMPGQGGVFTTREIVRCWPHIAVVAHTAYADEVYVREMVAAGARGYILKGDSPSAILEALSVSVRGGARLSAEVAGPVMQDLRTLYEQAINRSKQLEAENETLTQEVAHLNEVDRLKDEFLAMVSHELRSPITVLLGMASTLSNRPELASTTDGHEMLSRMVRQGVRLRDMVEQILQASAFAADRSPALHSEHVAVVDLIREIITDRQAADAEHPIVLHAPEQPRPVTGDSKALHAVVSNLIDNAAKHAPAGTPIEVMVSQPLGWTRIGVADRGPGVAVEDRQRIFAAFTQVDGSTTRRVSGVGLGLFLVDKFVRGMGGRVWVEEARGGGALFMVEIPDPEVSAEGEERQEAWPERGMYAAEAWR